LQRSELASPIFTRSSVEVVARFAAAKKWVGREESVDDLLGMLKIVLDPQGRNLPQVRESASFCNKLATAALVHCRPFRPTSGRIGVSIRLPGAPERVLDGSHDFILRHVTAAVTDSRSEHLHNFASR
jgi:hypothetical protein